MDESTAAEIVKKKLECAKLLLEESLKLAEETDLNVDLKDMLKFLDIENNKNSDIDSYYWLSSSLRC